MTADLERAAEIVAKLTAAGVNATIDPRAATPPCILGTPPNGVLDVACGFTAEWAWYALAPGNANVDAWRILAELRDAAIAVLPIRRFDFLSYVLASGAEAVPAYRLQFEEGI